MWELRATRGYFQYKGKKGGTVGGAELMRARKAGRQVPNRGTSVGEQAECTFRSPQGHNSWLEPLDIGW